jgi:cellulose synthase operon protein C
MSPLSATQISKPTDEQAFERACLVLFRCLLNDPNVQANAKRGQAQQGVDIFGFRNEETARPAGIQCKLKGHGKRLTEKEVRDEIAGALEFQPSLREYFIVTTAPDDGNLQRVARELAVQQGNAGRQINISVWGWETLEQRISEHPDALNAFDPTFGPHAKRHTEVLTKVVEGQSDLSGQLVKLTNRITEDSALVAASVPGDSTEIKNALEAALDAEIDGYRDAINDGRPKTALTLLEPLLKRVQHSSSGRVLFRIKANIGYCHLVLNDTARAAHWLSEAYHHAPSEPKAVANYALSMLLQKKKAAKEAHSNHPDHKFLIQCAAEAELDELGRCNEFREGRISSSLRQRMEEAASKLRGLWDQRRQTENPARPDGVAACCNLLVAYYALEKTSEALAVAKQVMELVPNDETRWGDSHHL